MQALILAGGKGTRLRPLTLHTPKPIVPIANPPLLVYQLELLKRAEVREVILSLSYQPQKIEDKLLDGTDHSVRISYMVETSPLGTAGAFRNAARPIRETTVVLNRDVPTDSGVGETDHAGRVKRFVEKPAPEEVTADTINAGIYVLEPRVLDYIPEGEPFMFEYDVFPGLLEAGEAFYGYTWRGYWRDVGSAPGSWQGQTGRPGGGPPP